MLTHKDSIYKVTMLILFDMSLSISTIAYDKNLVI
jgi:hypothetical protein